jgi:hypothetical protein
MIFRYDFDKCSTEHHKDTKYGHYQAWMLFEVKEFKLIVNV